MGGNGGKPKPGGAQIIKGKGMGGATQVQPAFASVTSVTPGEIAVSSEGTSPADGIALGEIAASLVTATDDETDAVTDGVDVGVVGSDP
jgi:hypothetical protein